MDGRFDRLEGRTGRIEAGMVTKDYLDDKLADLRGDLTLLVRKEDRKVDALIEVIQKRKGISIEEAERILAMAPFPHHA